MANACFDLVERCWSLSSHVAVTWALLVILDTKDITSILRWQLCFVTTVVEDFSTSCISVLTAESLPMASSSVCPFAAIYCQQ